MTILKRGSKGALVKQMQGGLFALGYKVGLVDGDFGGGTEDALEAFQDDHGLRDDGVFGHDTEEVYNKAVKKIGMLQWYVDLDWDDYGASEPSEKLRWVSTKNDKWTNKAGKALGLSRTTLRSDCAKAYQELQADVHAMGGILTTAGGKRPLKLRTGDPKKDKIGSAQSSKSLHYVGLAFDLALPTGGSSLSQPYLLQRDPANDRKWIVWCKSDSADVPEVEIKVCVISGWKKTSLSYRTVKVRAFNFTELALKHGFDGISGRRSFFRGGRFTGSEWWHFQWSRALTPGVSTFGGELLKLYSKSKCERFLFWKKARNAVWKRSWF